MKRQIATSLTALLWGSLTYLGYGLIANLTERHVPGYPSSGQRGYYVYFPIAMFVTSVASLLLAKRMPRAVFIAIWLPQLLVVLPFLFLYTGGM